MQIFFGSDHAAVRLKSLLVEEAKELGYHVVDLGTFSEDEKVDYPDIAREVGEKIQDNPGSFGVLLCGTGIGMCMAVNKMKGIRAATVHDVTTARLTRLHNDANVLCLGERITGQEVAKEILVTFMETIFEGGRHEARIQKMSDMEQN